MPHDPVSNPAHYNAGRTIEPIAVVEDWKLDYHKGSALKYLARAGRKGPEEQDLEKAIWFLQRRLHVLRSKPLPKPKIFTVSVKRRR